MQAGAFREREKAEELLQMLTLNGLMLELRRLNDILPGVNARGF
jgi:cell division protein FtsN